MSRRIAALDAGRFEGACGGERVEGGGCGASPGRGSNDAEQPGGDGEDERALKAEHPAHFGAQGGEVGFRGEVGEIGFRGEVATVGVRGGIGGLAHPFGDGFGLLGFDAGGLEVAGRGEPG